MIRRLMSARARGLSRAHGLRKISSSSRSSNYMRRVRPTLLFLIMFCLISFIVRWSSGPFAFSASFFLSSYDPPCSSISNGTVCCDRSHKKTDICFMKGDIRTHSPSKSIHVYYTNDKVKVNTKNKVIEKIKPYTRKWETSVMSTIDQVNLIQTPDRPQRVCDVNHDVPAVVFSTGGYTGNIFHEFNDGLIPLYITSHHYKRRVVFVIMKYKNWWYTKYRHVLPHLSDYPPIDFDSDTRTHCFPEAIVGLKFHDQLTVDPSLMTTDHKSINDFRDLFDRAFRPTINRMIKEEAKRSREEQTRRETKPPSSTYNDDDYLSPSSPERTNDHKKPRLVVLSRTGSRAITNEGALVSLAEMTGFNVRVVRPVATSELVEIYKTLNETDVVIGVCGAGMTHLLFMRPGSLLIQIVPIGTEWPSKKDFEEPAVKLGLNYMKYSILPRESSLLHQYREDDPVINDPNSVGMKGWEFTKKIYLDNQTITLDMQRFRKLLVDAYGYVSGLRCQDRSSYQIQEMFN